MRGLALALALISTPVLAAEQQFDLVCQGRDGRTPESKRYRIDLTRGEYCADDCKRVMKIAEVTSGLFTLFSTAPTILEPVTAYNTVNRVSGEWRWYHRDDRYAGVQDVRGACEPTTFSGMPTAKF